MVFSNFRSEISSAQEWTDFRLQWSPEEYDHIEEIHLPDHLLWRPDIVLYKQKTYVRWNQRQPWIKILKKRLSRIGKIRIETESVMWRGGSHKWSTSHAKLLFIFFIVEFKSINYQSKKWSWFKTFNITPSKRDTAGIVHYYTKQLGEDHFMVDRIQEYRLTVT